MLPTSFARIFSELELAQRKGVIERYAIAGAIGATFYIEAVATEDVDIFVAVDPARGDSLDPFRAVFDHFIARGATWQDEHLVMGGWPVHFLPSTGPLVDDALANGIAHQVDGQAVQVLTLEHLAAIAVETNRPKDKARMVQIWASERFDRDRFLELIERFGLGPRWERLKPLLEEAP